MTGMEIANRASLATNEHYQDRLPGLARQLAESSMCPETWRVKAGDPENVIERKIADLAIIGQSLAELDIRLGLTVLPQVYVVHGRPGFMAQLQIALAGRYGCPIVPLDDASDGTTATVTVLGKDRKWHQVTVTMDDAVKAGWPAKNPNYKTMPDRMLMARAVTKAISLHCPEAKLMLPDADRAEIIPVAAEEQVDDGETGELVGFREAGNLILDALEAQGLARDDARPHARLLWQSHGFQPGDSITRTRLDLILALLKAAPEPAAPEPVQAEVVGYEPGEEPF